MGKRPGLARGWGPRALIKADRDTGMRSTNATPLALVLALLCAVVLTAQQPPTPSGQQPAAGQQPAGAPGAPGQGRGRGGGFRQPDPIDFQEHDGWTSLFDGKTLNGWSGDENWKVEDGAIVIESTCEKPTGTVYLVWKGGEAADFELKLEMKGTGNINGGVQYRGWIAPRPQRGGGAGRAGAPPAAGALPRERPPLVRRRRVDRVVSDAPIRAHARVVPHAERYLRKSGVIGLEVEATGKLFTRNIWLKKLN
jgi:hypothetical protein